MALVDFMLATQQPSSAKNDQDKPKAVQQRKGRKSEQPDRNSQQQQAEQTSEPLMATRLVQRDETDIVIQLPSPPLSPPPSPSPPPARLKYSGLMNSAERSMCTTEFVKIESANMLEPIHSDLQCNASTDRERSSQNVENGQCTPEFENDCTIIDAFLNNVQL